MTTADKFALCAFLLLAFALVVFGGLFQPDTLAGAVARFVFSTH